MDSISLDRLLEMLFRRQIRFSSMFVLCFTEITGAVKEATSAVPDTEVTTGHPAGKTRSPWRLLGVVVKASIVQN